MKRFTYLLLTMLFVTLTASAKNITIYVQADQQPNIHYWGGVTSSEWPGEKLTETVVVNNLENQPVTFYYKTFTDLDEDAKVSFLFNYNADVDKTADINDISEDHYYIYKGNNEYEDITNQFKAIVDATIEKVQLPGSYCSWSGDNAPMADNGDKSYTYNLDLTSVSVETVQFKLLVADGTNSHWLGYNDLTINAPEGWLQDDGSDNHNIQLNLAAIGTKVFAVTATWGGGESASANWTLTIDGEADAVISHVQLPGSFNGWNGENAVLEKVTDGSYVYTLDLTDLAVTEATFKLLVNDHHWLGFNDLTGLTAADGWLQEAASDGNIQLNVAATGFTTFSVKAVWAGGKNASAGWSLTVTSITTGINAALNDKGQMRNAQVLFNLAGQRVMQPTRGLYIQNGRKYMVK